MNNGLALRVLESANDAPWRFLSGHEQASATALGGEPQIQSSGQVCGKDRGAF
jgi:hypothetical protein